MHSPEVLAFSIKRPWPHIKRRRESPLNDARGRFHWRFGSSFMYVGKYELYFPSIIDVWHMEPGGRDALTVCRDGYRDNQGKWHYTNGWKWHFWHYKISWSFIYAWRRRLFTRCAECGGPSRKGHVVNCSNAGWDGAPKTPLWCGEIKLYHPDCLAKVSQHYHDHDPAKCYSCKQKRLPEIILRMPYEQRELLDSLRVQCDLGLMENTQAVSRYNARRSKEKGWL